MGDFNFPCIVWSDGSGQLNPCPAYGTELNSLFLDVINDAGFEKLVTSQLTRVKYHANFCRSTPGLTWVHSRQTVHKNAVIIDLFLTLSMPSSESIPNINFAVLKLSPSFHRLFPV